MRKLTLTLPKNFLPYATVAAGFALIVLGIGRIFGEGVELIAAGIAALLFQWWVSSD